jgi:hypothetical protein
MNCIKIGVNSGAPEGKRPYSTNDTCRVTILTNRVIIELYIYIYMLQYKLESSSIQNPTTTNRNSNFY